VGMKASSTEPYWPNRERRSSMVVLHGMFPTYLHRQQCTRRHRHNKRGQRVTITACKAARCWITAAPYPSKPHAQLTTPGHATAVSIAARRLLLAQLALIALISSY
jgi:hypothetical protein